jgi:DNA-binding MarR family transcriptional regulator
VPKKAVVEEAEPGERRFQIVVTTDGAGFEQFTIERLIDLAHVPNDDIADDQLIELACRLYDTRRARTRYLAEVSGEPAWDMLLALFCLPARKKRLSVSGLSHAAEVPVTTGLRWLGKMESCGLVERTPDETDARRFYLSLTSKGEQLMRDYLSAIYHRLTAA